jgi:hypothetical protein
VPEEIVVYLDGGSPATHAIAEFGMQVLEGHRGDPIHRTEKVELGPVALSTAATIAAK